MKITIGDFEFPLRRGGSRSPMGPWAPLWFGKGDHVAQRAEAMKQHDGGDTCGFYPGLGRWVA
jgi:hypothetical protein